MLDDVCEFPGDCATSGPAQHCAPLSPPVTLKYKDGKKKILVTPQTVIVTYVPGDKSELKSGAKIFIAGAAKKEDGMLEAASISVGRDGLTPPM
jgi:hypothetical protein